MRLHFRNAKASLLGLVAFVLAGAGLGSVMYTGSESPVLTAAIGSGVAALFWSLFAVQDLHITRKGR